MNPMYYEPPDYRPRYEHPIEPGKTAEQKIAELRQEYPNAWMIIPIRTASGLKIRVEEHPWLGASDQPEAFWYNPATAGQESAKRKR
jgi:hypothetical protein